LDAAVPLIEINWTPSTREVRQFAGLVAVFAALVGGLLVYRSGAWHAARIVWVTGAAIAAVGLAAPRLIRPLMVGWMMAAYPIGWTVSWIVLLATFYGILLPVALIMRVFRYDPLDRRIEPEAATYWVEHDQAAGPAAYFRQF
jgi:carbamoyltransferase